MKKLTEEKDKKTTVNYKFGYSASLEFKDFKTSEESYPNLELFTANFGDFILVKTIDESSFKIMHSCKTKSGEWKVAEVQTERKYTNGFFIENYHILQESSNFFLKNVEGDTNSKISFKLQQEFDNSIIHSAGVIVSEFGSTNEDFRIVGIYKQKEDQKITTFLLLNSILLDLRSTAGNLLYTKCKETTTQ